MPKQVQSDNGKVLYNKSIQDLMKEYGFNLYSVFSDKKVAICERFNKTIKEKMWKALSSQGTYK
jgi:hypothetical protein